MGVFSTGDLYLTEDAMIRSAEFVTGPWRYERIERVRHWIPSDASEQFNRLMLDFLRAKLAVYRVPCREQRSSTACGRFGAVLYCAAEGCPSGLWYRSRKAACLNRAPWVRIPPLPPGWPSFRCAWRCQHALLLALCGSWRSPGGVP